MCIRDRHWGVSPRTAPGRTAVCGPARGTRFMVAAFLSGCRSVGRVLCALPRVRVGVDRVPPPAKTEAVSEAEIDAYLATLEEPKRATLCETAPDQPRHHPRSRTVHLLRPAGVPARPASPTPLVASHACLELCKTTRSCLLEPADQSKVRTLPDSGWCRAGRFESRGPGLTVVRSGPLRCPYCNVGAVQEHCFVSDRSVT